MTAPSNMPLPLSVIVITKNEEHNIDACLDSVSFSDDIVVVDAASTDRTVEIARERGATVFVEEWLGFSEAKSFALRHVRHDWVFWLDADERLTEEARDEIQLIASSGDTRFAAYRIARKSFFLGKWIRHSGWYPGYVTRLFRKSLSRFSDSDVHEFLEVEGLTGTLRHDILHYTDADLNHYFSKYNRYTTLAAEEMQRKGRRANPADLLLRPLIVFLKMYFIRLGFLDGMEGFILARLSASYVFTKYAKLWEAVRIKSASDRN